MRTAAAAFISAMLLATPAAFAQSSTSPAYGYAGSHAGGYANGVRRPYARSPYAAPRPVARWKSPAYRYSGSHAGGTANALRRPGNRAPHYSMRAPLPYQGKGATR